MNSKLSPGERADLLLKQMTLDETIQLVHGSFGAALPQLVPTAPAGALGGDGFVPGIPRLGIPDLNLIGAGLGATDLGHRKNGQSTALPSSLTETHNATKAIPMMQKNFGSDGTFWCFSAGALLTIILVGLLVPETKGRSLEEITEIWAQPAENEAVG